MTKPLCANWNLWIGLEIEGYSDIGVATLFVRSATFEEIQKHSVGVDRIWFDVKFNDTSEESIRKFKSLNKKLIFDMTPVVYYRFVNQNRQDILSEQLYVRFNDVILKPGDHIKIGTEFHEEAFEIGTGKKSSPELYSNDICIK